MILYFYPEDPLEIKHNLIRYARRNSINIQFTVTNTSPSEVTLSKSVIKFPKPVTISIHSFSRINENLNIKIKHIQYGGVLELNLREDIKQYDGYILSNQGKLLNTYIHKPIFLTNTCNKGGFTIMPCTIPTGSSAIFTFRANEKRRASSFPGGELYLGRQLKPNEVTRFCVEYGSPIKEKCYEFTGSEIQ